MKSIKSLNNTKILSGLLYEVKQCFTEPDGTVVYPQQTLMAINSFVEQPMQVLMHRMLAQNGRIVILDDGFKNRLEEINRPLFRVDGTQKE